VAGVCVVDTVRSTINQSAVCSVYGDTVFPPPAGDRTALDPSAPAMAVSNSRSARPGWEATTDVLALGSEALV
jgi:hypothetical protein